MAGGLTCHTVYLNCVHWCTQVYLRYSECMPANTSVEIGIRKLRETLPDVLHDASIRGRITYVTNHGRRVAAIVPVPLAESFEAQQQPEGDSSSA